MQLRINYITQPCFLHVLPIYMYLHVIHYSMAIKQGIIYCITNKVNKKQYVGTTTLPLNKVWKEHITNNTHKDLYNDINNLGTSRFNISVLEKQQLID